MSRLIALLSSLGLVAGLLVVGSAPASAGCASGTKTLGGTIQGEDSRFVFGFVGVELFDAAGNRIDKNGCRATVGGYHITVAVNTSLDASGAISGSGLTKNWSAQVPSNTARVYLEAYPKTAVTDPPGLTDKTRYGSVLRHNVPVRSNYPLVLPLNCGLEGGGIEGSNGTIIGNVTRNGQPVTPDRVSVWTLGLDTDARPLGWSIATIKSGGFVADAMASGQAYQIYVTQGGSTKRLLWIPLNPCANLELDIDMNPAVPQTVPGATFYLSNSFGGGNAAITTIFGMPGDQPVIGDWDGNGHDDIGVRRGARFEVRYGTGPGYPSKVFGYGRPGDELFIGDWDGDGVDTLAVRRGNQFFIRNDTNSGPAHVVLGYGKAGDEVFVGDWDGDGKDTFAVRRGNIFYLRNDLKPGNASTVFGYGKAGDEVLIGDWNGNGKDTFAVRRGNEYFLRNDTRSGAAHIKFAYGKPTDTVLVGDFDADGVDAFGVHR